MSDQEREFTKPKNAAERRIRDGRALELRRAGVGWDAVIAKLKFTGLKQAQESVDRARALDGLSATDFASVAELEMERLNRLQQVVWARAVAGEPAAIDRASRLSMDRVKIAAYAAKVAKPRVVPAEPSPVQDPREEVDDLASFRQRHRPPA